MFICHSLLHTTSIEKSDVSKFLIQALFSYRRVKQRMLMTVSSETMHENHNRDAAYDSVDIPLSLSSVDMAAANTEKN